VNLLIIVVGLMSKCCSASNSVVIFAWALYDGISSVRRAAASAHPAMVLKLMHVVEATKSTGRHYHSQIPDAD
jgi:hypothetical protein